jgi:DNA-binding SARP family transcriptional activator
MDQESLLQPGRRALPSVRSVSPGLSLFYAEAHSQTAVRDAQGRLLAYAGVNVRRERIIDAVWPDKEGDMGRKAFEAAVHRLGRLVGDHEAIEFKEGRLCLNPDRTSVDIWAFEALASARAERGEYG